MDAETLTFLLAGGHLNMEERIGRGLWPHPPIPYESVVQHLTELVAHRRWFPVEWRPHKPGEPVREGGIVENRGLEFIYRNGASHPLSPVLLNGQVELTFIDPRDAAEHYLKWDLRLPGRLDGWVVER
jgi:hypothetical protein